MPDDHATPTATKDRHAKAVEAAALCSGCGGFHPKAFTWRGRTRLWHAQQRDSAR